MSHKVKVFVPKATREMVAEAIAEYPFLRGVKVDFVTNSTEAERKAWTDADAALPSNNCVTAVLSNVPHPAGLGWNIELQILD